MNKANICHNFSRCAYLYDKYSDVQRMSALEILNGIDSRDFAHVLEIGCGTGNYTSLLREKFKNTRITALDISGRMVEVAQGKLRDKNIEFVVGDGESVDMTRENFDLITSNACFQWFENLDKALKKYKGLLKKNGLILFSLFGPLTFRELGESLACVAQNASIPAGSFIDKDTINNLLKGEYKNVTIKELIYEESFNNLRELLEKIKYSGIKGGGLRNMIYLGKNNLERLEETYLNKFKQIKATYQIFCCQGYVS